MKHLVTIDLGNTTPSDGDTDVRLVRESWEEAQTTLEARPAVVIADRKAQSAYEVSIDGSDVIDLLRAVEACEYDGALLDARWKELESVGRHPMSSRLIVRLDLVSGPAPDSIPFSRIGKFLQQLFLGMNLARPGSFSLFGASYPDHPNESYGPPDLSADLLEGAWAHFRKHKWPAVEALPFERVWAWLHDQMVYDIDIAETPSHRALFTLLRACSRETNEPDIILLIAQALESFFSSGKEAIGSTLRQRLELVLGTPESHKNWCGKFYERRSRIAHGSIPMLRPGHYYDGEDPRIEEYTREFFGPLDEAIAVLVAVLQDLVRHDAQSYSFAEQVKRLS